jgi:hypothetical protein
VREVLPSAAVVQRAATAFADAGFEVGPVVGNSCSITAPKTTFEKVFGTKLHRNKQSGDVRPAPHGASEYELPLSKLPKSVTQLVETVTLTPPPDFGPTNY